MNQPELEKYTLAQMKPVVIKSRDGLDLVAYLTVPPGAEPKNLPLVLNVHGGPWARDTWGYNWKPNGWPTADTPRSRSTSAVLPDWGRVS